MRHWLASSAVPLEYLTQQLHEQHPAPVSGSDDNHREQNADDSESGADESYTSRIVGLAMVGLYCTQNMDEAGCSAEVCLPPAGAMITSGRAPLLQPRTPSSRARSEFNDINPQLVGRRSSTASSASPSLSATPANCCSPTLSPLTSSPSISTPMFAYSPASTSPPIAYNVPSTMTPLLTTTEPSAPPTRSTPDIAVTRQPTQPFDASMHQRVRDRLCSRLAVDGSTLSDKRLIAHPASPTLSSAPSALNVIDERAPP